MLKGVRMVYHSSQHQHPSCPALPLEPMPAPGDAGSLPGRVTWLLLPSCLWCTVFNSTHTQDSPSAPAQSTGSHVLSSSWAGRDKRSLVQARTRLPGCPSTCPSTFPQYSWPDPSLLTCLRSAYFQAGSAWCLLQIYCTHISHRNSTLTGCHGRQNGALPVWWPDVSYSLASPAWSLPGNEKRTPTMEKIIQHDTHKVWHVVMLQLLVLNPSLISPTAAPPSRRFSGHALTVPTSSAGS